MIDTKKLEVERTLSVERAAGHRHRAGRASRVTRDGCAADRRRTRARTRSPCSRCPRTKRGAERSRARAQRADARPPARGPARRRAGRDRARGGRRDLRRGGRGGGRGREGGAAGPAQGQGLLADRPRARSASYPRGRARRRASASSSGSRPRAWASGRTRCSRARPIPRDPGSATDDAPESFRFKYLPVVHVRPLRRSSPFPTDARLRKLTPRAVAPDPAVNAQKPPAGTPAHDARPERQDQARLLHRAREPHLRPDPRRRRARRRRPEARRCSARRSRRTRTRWPSASRCSTTSTRTPRRRSTATSGPRPAAVSDYVVKNWHQNYGGRKRPYDFGVYSVTWPAAAASCSTRPRSRASRSSTSARRSPAPCRCTDKDRTAGGDAASRRASSRKSDLGKLGACDLGRRRRLLPQRRLVGRRRRGPVGRPGPGHRGVRLARCPATAPRRPARQSRFDCFQHALQRSRSRQDARAEVHLHRRCANDHTAAPRRAGARRSAMVAENDYGARPDRRPDLATRRSGRSR